MSSSTTLDAFSGLSEPPMETNQHCFHCGDALPTHDFKVEVSGEIHSVCCPGCQAAVELIHTTDMQVFYQQRGKQRPGRVAEMDEAFWRHYDEKTISAEFLESTADSEQQCTLHIDGMYCQACAWLIEQTLGIQHPELHTINVDPERQSVSLTWQKDTLRFSDTLITLSHLGYKPTPVALGKSLSYQQQASKDMLKRLGVAGFGMMQVMMYAVGLYAGEFQGIDEHFQSLLTLVSLLVSTLVVFYSGQPFFQHAWLDLKNRHVGMDVPIALAIAGAYSISVVNTLLANQNPVYFESVVMFIFFILLGRYLEVRARHATASSTEALQRLLPQIVQIERQGQPQTVHLAAIVQGDTVYLKPGDIVPCDGQLLEGEALLDESLLTGEAKPQARRSGDSLIAGTSVLEGRFSLSATRLGQDSTLSQIDQILQGANKPASLMLADQLARYIVLAMLLLALLTGIAWAMIDSSRVIPSVLAILVATCPCALSLATPVAFTVSHKVLSQHGVLLANGEALVSLAKGVHHWCFDKTGTLTNGQMHIAAIDHLASHQADASMADNELIALAQALEQKNEHVIAGAFNQYPLPAPLLLKASELTQHTSLGIEGIIQGKNYRLGTTHWASREGRLDNLPVNTDYAKHTIVTLADKQNILAHFYLADTVRPSAKPSIDSLKNQGVHISLLSGDQEDAVKAMAKHLGIEQYHNQQLPQDKLHYLKQQQNSGQRIAMVGDGINDAPVLAQADIGITLANGSQLAQGAADILLLNGQLTAIQYTQKVARFCQRIIRQNLTWALMYNISVLPLAAAGLLPPWLAALGMSCSSLLVVLNANRIQKLKI